MILLLAQLALGAHAVPLVTRADGPDRTSPAEVRVVMPTVHGSFARGPLQVQASLSLEGLTMDGGHLTPGAWGEGFIDRRHPHTYAHELMVSLIEPVRLPVRWSLSAGKGFAPFGTDDPMSRPALLFPVNHHLSQILERAVVIGALGAGPLLLEGGVFNGDEPEKPTQWPELARFHDSWSARLTAAFAGLELQLSRARVASPEHRGGAGLDHDMWNGSARLARATRVGHLYAMAEVSRTDEEGAYQFGGFLAEAQLSAGAHRPWLRFERTERPEEVRQFGDEYRGVRPHNENANLGATRWTTIGAGYGYLVKRHGPASFEALVELSRAHVTRVTGIAFDPESFYGRNDLWAFSVGLRIRAGAPMHRMGRYGLSAGQTSGHHLDH